MKMKLLNFLLLLVFSLFVFTQSLQENDGDDGNSDESAEPAVVLLFLFFGIIVGVLITQFLSIFGEAIPYTVLVFLAGMLFSTASGKSNTFGQSVDQWVEIDAELLLYVFLPPLIFGEAMSLNWYHLKVAFAQSVILAGPGVLIGAALMGVMTKFILPYNWNWNLLMTFGAVLSATDTVAVLSLLKSVGASPKLTILIVGESLLNDGSAIVLFTIFFNALKGTTYTASAIIGFSFAASIGSLALGIVSGLIVVRWLRSANRPLKETDVTMQIAMTISSAYIIFFVAEFSLDISGVLACCGAGAMVAWLGPPIILNHESMHNVWGMAEWTLNTLIFLLAGLIIGHRVLEKVVAIDWLYMFILYAVLMAIRGVTVFILYPFVSSIGHRCTWLEAVFMSWTGLRGAVGMALALIVEKSGPEDLDAETKRLFFYVGGIATLSLVINGTTAKSLLYSLGLLTTNSAEKILVTNQIKKKLQRKMDKVVTHMTKEFAFTDQDLEEVRLSCTLLQDINMDALYRDTERASALLADTIRDHQIQDRTHVIIQDRVLAYENDHDYDDVDDDDDDDDDDESDRRKSRNSKNPLHNKSAASERSQASPKSKLPSRSQMSHMSRVLSSVGLNPEAINSHNTQTRLHRISRFLSMGARGSSPVLEYDLLMYIRSIFLEIVRVKYWHFIEIGKLPRLSFASQFLLYSIEVGLDEVNTKNTKELDIDNRYVKDWLCIEHFINDPLPITNLLMFLERKLPRICAGNSITDALAFLEIRREKRSVYVLQAFIEAHEHAQSKIHSFLGVEEENDDDDNEEHENENKEHENENEEHGVLLEARKKEKSVKSERSKVANRTPEEVKVIDESKQAVDKAKKLLSEMDAQTVAGIRSKQAARMVLAKEAEMVRSLVEEGLLTPKHAEEFLEEINTDTTRIEKERNQLYREQARRRKQQRKANLWDEWNGSDPLIHAK